MESIPPQLDPNRMLHWSSRHIQNPYTMEYKPIHHLKLETDIATGTVALKTGFKHLLLHFVHVSSLEQLGILILGILTEALLHDNIIPNHRTYNVVEVMLCSPP